jgi:hypothetical protein
MVVLPCCAICDVALLMSVLVRAIRIERGRLIKHGHSYAWFARCSIALWRSSGSLRCCSVAWTPTKTPRRTALGRRCLGGLHPWQSRTEGHPVRSRGVLDEASPPSSTPIRCMTSPSCTAGYASEESLAHRAHGIESSATLGKHRWVIERTISGLFGYRRLTIRYERTPICSTASSLSSPY